MSICLLKRNFTEKNSMSVLLVYEAQTPNLVPGKVEKENHIRKVWKSEERKVKYIQGAGTVSSPL